MLDKMADFTTQLLFTLGNVFKIEAGSYFDIETCEHDMQTFVRSNGHLVTLVDIRGVQRFLGYEEMQIYLSQLEDKLSYIFANSGHELQFVMMRDPTGIRREIDNILAPARKTSKVLGLDSDWILDKKAEALYEYCASESAWIAISTDYSIFSPAESKEDQLERGVKLKQTPRGSFGQNTAGSSSGIYSNHISLVNNFVDGLKEIGVVCEIIDAHSALFAIRKEVDPDGTSDDWRALLPGDPAPIRLKDAPNDDLSHVLYPRLADQVFPRGAGKVVHSRWIEVGDRIVSPVAISMPQQTPSSFQALLGSLMEANIPFRISFDLKPDGMKGLGLKSTLSSILHITSNVNKQFNAAYDGLRQMVLDGEPVIGLKIIACTWADIDDHNTIRHRTARLSQCLQSWGNCETMQIMGDPLMGLTATLPGAMDVNPAPKCAVNVSGVIGMLPMTRPASPWLSGALILRSADGKVLPYQPGSSLQSAAVTLAFAPMGQGKSVLLNAHNLALAMREGLERIPYIAILDIGPSSSGLISLYQEMLPKEQRHLAIYKRLQMIPKDSINPFDLPLGLRKPLPDHKAMLSNFLTMLCTEPGLDMPESGVSGVSGMLIDLVYDYYSERTPKRFDPHQNRYLTERIIELKIPVDTATTWFEIVDEFFDLAENSADDGHNAVSKRLYEDAIIAQRYAVPLLGDCASIVKDPAIESMYGGAHVSTSENVIEYVWRMINEAINELPILAQPTQFDIGNARIVALDLDEVCPKGSKKADKQTAIMYMLSRYVIAQRYYFGKESIPFFPDKFKRYQLEKALEISADPKLICFDEYHRTGGVSIIREQVLRDIREGRKWNVQVMLVSQSISDFDPIIIKLSTTRFVLGANTPEDADEICKRFELSPSAKRILLERITKPSRRGAGMYVSATTSKGRSELFTYLTLGATELWAFDSTAENRTLRGILYERVGAKKALSYLVKYFPNGSALDEIERRKSSSGSGYDDMEQKVTNIIEHLASEIIQREAGFL